MNVLSKRFDSKGKEIAGGQREKRGTSKKAIMT
jgi:hypothetical protein